MFSIWPSIQQASSLLFYPCTEPKGREVDEHDTHIREKRCGALKLHVNTFRGDLQLATLGDLDSLLRLVTMSSRVALDLLHDVVALKNLAEDDVLAIKPAVQVNFGQLRRQCGIILSPESRQAHLVTTVVMKN